MRLASTIAFEPIRGFADYLKSLHVLHAPKFIKEGFDEIEAKRLEVYAVKSPELVALLIVDPRKKQIIWGCGLGDPSYIHRPQRYPSAEIGRQIKIQAELRGWRIKPTSALMTKELTDEGQKYGMFAQIRCGGQIRDVDDVPAHVKGDLELDGMPSADISTLRRLDGSLFSCSVPLRNPVISDLTVTDPKAWVSLEFTGIRSIHNVQGGAWRVGGNPGLTLGPGINVDCFSTGNQHIELPPDLQVKHRLIVPKSVKVPAHLKEVTLFWEDMDFLPEDQVHRIVTEHRIDATRPDTGEDIDFD